MGAKARQDEDRPAPHPRRRRTHPRCARDDWPGYGKLLVDANNAYSVPDAIKMARYLEKYDVFWYEEPVNCDDIPGQAAVTAATDIPVAIGENEYTRWGFRDLGGQ